MINTSEYRRRMSALARAEATRGRDGQPIPRLSLVSLARRFEQGSSPETGGVDPIAASKVDRWPWMLRV